MSAPATAISRSRLPALLWLIPVCLGALVWVFWAGLEEMVKIWFVREEYSHAVLIPPIALYLAWQKRSELADTDFHPSWSGVPIVILGVAVNVLGELATVFVLQQLGFLVALAGAIVALAGWPIMRVLRTPFVVLLFMVPLPNVLWINFSAQLQLISSHLGVLVIRLFGISVFVEGNVIDLGGYKLQVAEACDGLRYLFPLMTLGFLMSNFFKVAMWKRVVLFLSSIPITIFMNSFRIGTIGVMVEHWGPTMAEGFLHEFQGWVVFMAATALMLLEMMYLARIGKDRRPWRDVFGLEPPAPSKRTLSDQLQTASTPFVASTVALLGFGVLVSLMPKTAEAIPSRELFYSFPTQVSGWSGRRTSMDQMFIDALLLDDYIMADYTKAGGDPVNFYVAWYDSQQAAVTHSPRSCLPGTGWQMTTFEQVDLPNMRQGSMPLRVNRAVIEMGSHKQLVYYWFKQRDRIVTNEYLVKWFLFWDSLTRHRTDGALIRLVTPVIASESIAASDARLQQFAADIVPKLAPYVPD